MSADRWEGSANIYDDVDLLSDMYNPTRQNENAIDLNVEPDGSDIVLQKENKDPQQILPTQRPVPMSREELDTVICEIASSGAPMIPEEESLRSFRRTESAPKWQIQSSPEYRAGSRQKPVRDMPSENPPELVKVPKTGKPRNVAMANLGKLSNTVGGTSGNNGLETNWSPYKVKSFKINPDDFPPLG